MPKVPVYEQNQVQETGFNYATNTAKPSMETFGGGDAGISRVINDAGKVAMQVYQQEKKRADEVALYEADAKLTKLETDLLYDPKVGALNQKGKNSFDVATTTLPEYKKRSDEILAGLSSNEQKAAFERVRSERGSNIDRALQRHVSTESIRYDQEVTTNFVKNEQELAAKNYRDPKAVSGSLLRQEQAIRDYGRRYGLSDEETQAQLLKVKSETHENVINRLIANDQEYGAQTYVNKYKNEISADKLSRIEGALDIAVDRATSQKKVDSFIGQGLSMNEAFGEASKITDSKLRESVENRIKNQYAIQENMKRAEFEKIHVGALNIIDQTGSLDSVIKQMPSQWASMDVSHRNSLINYAEQKAQGNTVKSDPDTFYFLKLMSSAKDTRDDFIKEDLTRYRSKLNDRDWKDLVGDQTALRNKDGKVESKLDGFMNKHAIVKEGFKEAGFDYKDDAKELRRFNEVIDQEVATRQKGLGRELTNEELRGLVKDYTVDVVTKENKYWFDQKKKLFNLDASEIRSVKYKDIPPTDRLKIENALKKKGMAATQNQVREMFIMKFNKGQ